MRTLLGWLLGVAGVVAVGYGVFKPWYGERAADEVGVAELFSGPGEAAGLIGSLAVPLLIGALLVVVGLVVSNAALRGGVVVLVAVVVVWVVQYGGIDGLRVGFWNVAFGTVLVAVAAGVKP